MKRTRITLAVLLTALASLQAQAQTQDRLAVTELKPLLLLALEQGEAHGVLSGPPAAYLQRRFASTTPVEIDVRTVHPLPQPGCRRLSVTTRQQQVREKERSEDKELTYQLNYCRDGAKPRNN